MADLSRPRPQVSATLSKKVASNGNGFGAKNVYQDVFGGPPKFGLPSFSSRVDDYSEIFGGYHASRGSSIPFLDLPDVDESAFLMDVRSSKLDYSEVFGGSGRVDFAVPYEELFAEPVGVESSSEDVWTPAETGSPSEGSSEDPSCLENIQAFSNGKSHHPSYESVQQINTFYHKSKTRSTEDGISGTTHVAQLNAVPAYTLVVDEVIPTQKEKYEKPLHQVANDVSLNLDSFIELTDGKLFGNKSSRQAAGDTILRTSENVPKTQRSPDRSGTASERAFLTVTEINLRTRPSQVPPPARPPPKLAIKQGESKKPEASSLSKKYSFEGAIKDGSPVFYDVEVDASSSAAASAAAMKEAMEKAQARLKSAKVSMERKREGLHNRKKLGLKEDFIVKEKVESETARELYRTKEDDSYFRKFKKDYNEKKGFDIDERQQTQSYQVSPAFETRTGLLSVSKESLDQISVKEWIKNHETHQQEGTGETENQLSGLVLMDKFKPVVRSSEKAKDGIELMMPNAKFYESQQNGKQPASVLFKEQEEKHRMLNVSEEKCERETNEEKIEVAKDFHKESRKKVRVTASNGNLEARENKSKAAYERVEHDNKVDEMCFNMVHEAGKRMKEVNEQKEPETEQQKKNGVEHDEACQWVENENNKIYAKEREEDAKRVKVAYEQDESGRIQKEIPEPEENEKRQEEAYEREDQWGQNPVCKGEADQICQKEAFRCEEHDQRAKKFLEQEENEKQQKESVGGEENLKKLEELQVGKENEKRPKEVWKKEQIEKQPQEAREYGNVKPKGIMEQDENEKQQKEVHKWEGKELKELQEEENAKKLKEAHESNEIQRRKEDSESEEEEKIMKEALEPEESDMKKQVCDGEDSGKKIKALQDTYICKEEEKNLKISPELCETSGSEQTFEVSSETFILNEDSILEAKYEFRGQEGESISLKVAQEPCEEKETKVDNITVQYVLEKNEEEPNAAKVEIQPPENEVLTELYVEQGVTEEEKVIPDSKFGCDCNEKKLQEAKDAKEDDKNIKAKETAFSKEEDKITCKAAQNVRQENGHGSRIEAAWPAHTLDEKRDGANVVNDINKESNLGEVSKVGERGKEERIEQKKEQEMERLRKLEEEREREREREKDRMAVERVTREARERAFAEARERAERVAVERVTAEARQRAMAEARERLEKASVEARLRAERAAVERATAEAQERAMEKAMAGKAGLGAKERIDRSVSEKFSASSRDSSVKHSASFSDLRESQFQSSGSFNGSQRYPDSSSHAFATEKSQGVEAESAQRCKARLERHQRTVQRAAKALAEKNMRDLLAQREQAERNRLAETLDADVKRWSSGKEGNLRALLSTLQYILGPESGWQPVPLTEVITAVAVKKAYRKATLCVHPDKLQQRGASIQQKYICEKVFDLLKEAWNKFNSEER